MKRIKTLWAKHGKQVSRFARLTAYAFMAQQAVYVGGDIPLDRKTLAAGLVGALGVAWRTMFPTVPVPKGQ